MSQTLSKRQPRRQTDMTGQVRKVGGRPGCPWAAENPADHTNRAANHPEVDASTSPGRGWHSSLTGEEDKDGVMGGGMNTTKKKSDSPNGWAMSGETAPFPGTFFGWKPSGSTANGSQNYKLFGGLALFTYIFRPPFFRTSLEFLRCCEPRGGARACGVHPPSSML